MPRSAASSRADSAHHTLTKVPEIALVFWVLKLLTTGMGEAMSDSLGQQSVPLAALIGIVGIVVALRLQLRQTEYRAPYYWFAVMMVAIFGTMAADGIRDGAGIPYSVTTPMFAIITATGDLTAYQLHLGFWLSAALFAVVFAIPAVGWWRLRWNPIIAFWFAYIDTRPLGASFADGFSKPTSGGLGLGDPLVSLAEFVLFVELVTWVTVTRHDVQRTLVPTPPREHEDHHEHGRPVPARLATEFE